MSTRLLSKAINCPFGDQSELIEKRRGLDVSFWTALPSGRATWISALFTFGLKRVNEISPSGPGNVAVADCPPSAITASRTHADHNRPSLTHVVLPYRLQRLTRPEARVYARSMVVRPSMWVR